MELDLLDFYRRTSEWANQKVQGAVRKFDARTPCEDWDVRTLLNHMLDTQRYFLGTARGEDATLPAASPPDLLSDDPVSDFVSMREQMLEAYGDAAVIERTGPSLGIAASDQLLHAWDLAVATGQDTTMPDGLAELDYELVHGRFTDEQRKGIFKPEIPVPDDASPQDRLLAYTGRSPG